MSDIEKKIKKMEDKSIVILLLILTILHTTVNISNLSNLSKLNFKLNFDIIFNTFYIDLVVLIISYFIYREINYNFHNKNNN
jgi:hypothetical protein